MRGKRLVALCLFSTSTLGAWAEQGVSLTKCDKYAASNFLNLRDNVPFENIDPQLAIPSCKEAVRTNPESGRLLFELGRSYARATEYTLALDSLHKAADRGYLPALTFIGTLYADGHGVQKDQHEATLWYRRSAEQGDVSGELNLGSAYENGLGVSRDYSVALQWFLKAAEKGSALGQDSVGYFYASGLGVKADQATAAKWFRKAALQGMPGAQYNLGTMYEQGLGVTKDLYEASMWYAKSANQGSEAAKASLKTVHAKMIEESKKPAGIAVTAQGAGVVPGAIICPDHATVALVFDLYSEHWADALQDKLTNNQSRLIRGQPASAPDLTSYGCRIGARLDVR